MFDGPNKPPFKRNKRTGPNIASIPEFLAKQLLKQFGFPFHIAPGEAEAECALLQREGMVDAVLSEDVDTLMFGSGLTIRNWSPEGSKSKTPTHVNLYDAVKTKSGASGLDREGMVLVALMSGGDYIPEGIPGCGPKLACEAARAGFGKELCNISRSNKIQLRVWRERLAHELRTNESKFFKTKHSALVIPEDFPNPEVLGYYTHPAISGPEKLARLKSTLQWDQPINFAELRTFTADAFDWTKLGGAKNFIRNLAPAVLLQQLRLRGRPDSQATENLDEIAAEEAKLVKSIHGKRNHPSTDETTELRIAFRAAELVDIDLSIEEPDDETPQDQSDDEVEAQEVDDDDDAALEPTAKKRAPSKYDPSQVEKMWILETFVKVGVPLKVQDWEESFRNPKKYNAMKAANKKAAKSSNTRRRLPKPASQTGTLDQFTRVTKPHLEPPSSKATLSSTHIPPQDIEPTQAASQPLPSTQSTFRALRAMPELSTEVRERIAEASIPQGSMALRSLSKPADDMLVELPSAVNKRRRSPLKRWQTDTAILDLSAHDRRVGTPSKSRSIVLERELPSPSPRATRTKRAKSTKNAQSAASLTPTRRTPKKQIAVVDLLSSSPARQTSIMSFFSPSKPRNIAELNAGDDETMEPPQSPTRQGSRNILARSIEPLRETSINSRGTGKEGERNSAGASKATSSSSCHARTASDSHHYSEMLAQDCEELPSAMPPASRGFQAMPPIDLSTSSDPFRLPRSQESLVKPSKGKSKPRKQVIRIRESLVGAFAVEEVDLSGSPAAGPAVAGARKKYRGSEVFCLDLTGH